MKKSPPKVVSIDLGKYNKQYNTAPHKKYSTKPPQTTPLEFSFSHENKKQSLIANQSLYKKKKSPITPKPPFKFSPVKPYENYKSQSTEKSGSKQKKLINQHYQKFNQTDKLFKNSTEKLKNKFFNNLQMKKMKQQQLTKQMLKKIGKYATNRSNDKLNKEHIKKQKLAKKKDIKVQYYGFDSKKYNQLYRQKSDISKIQDKVSPIENANEFNIKQHLKQVDAYRTFQKQYNQQLQKGNNKHSLPGIKQPSLRSKHINSTQKIKPTTQIYEFQNITQEKIALILQIFQFCDKGDQGDKLILSDFYNFLAQLQRLYVIKVIQQNQRSHYKKSQCLTESQFSQLLKEFEKTFKIIFYRKTKNDIYDAIFYLSEDNILDTICTIFLQIKDTLSI